MPSLVRVQLMSGAARAEEMGKNRKLRVTVTGEMRKRSVTSVVVAEKVLAGI